MFDGGSGAPTASLLERLDQRRQRPLTLVSARGRLRQDNPGQQLAGGTRCTIILLERGGQDDAMILQQKETGPSVLEPYLAPSAYASHAQRVVQGQRLMQAASDIFLGWHQGSVTGSHYYLRQLKDM